MLVRSWLDLLTSTLRHGNLYLMLCNSVKTLSKAFQSFSPFQGDVPFTRPLQNFEGCPRGGGGGDCYTCGNLECDHVYWQPIGGPNRKAFQNQRAIVPVQLSLYILSFDLFYSRGKMARSDPLYPGLVFVPALGPDL
jgi:hypothetical protein